MPCSKYPSKAQRRACFASDGWTKPLKKRKKKVKKRRKR